LRRGGPCGHDGRVTNDDRALVLGGGGLAGIAWMTGLLFGLSERGVDMLLADVIVATSAGSTVAAQITSGMPLSELFARQVDAALQTREIVPGGELVASFQKMIAGDSSSLDRGEFLRNFGRFAVAAPTVSEEERRVVIAGRLPNHAWPENRLVIVAVDTETGEDCLFDRFTGVRLVDAVAASCAVPGVWPPVTIAGRRYMDGGVRSSDNADLARGYGRTAILSPNGTTRPALKEHMALLEAGGGRVFMVEPDEAARAAIGANSLLPETREPAANAGLEQGHAIAPELGLFWG
jgi:NTE family protein